MNELIKNMTIDYLYGTKYGEKLKDIVRILEDAQAGANAYAESDPEDKLPYLKIGTILLLGILQKMGTGKMPKDFTTSDFADIADRVTDIAIKMDEQEYSAFVFMLFAKYIEYSAKVIAVVASKEKADAINDLARELNTKTKLLTDGEIQEAKYIEECLWICLEATIKLIAAYSAKYTGQRGTEFVENVSIFAFEYGRYLLYKREQKLVTEYIEKQKVIDEELQAKLEQYIKDVQSKQNEFTFLVQNAFDKNFRTALVASAQLAASAGVRSEEILTSAEDVDDFFLN